MSGISCASPSASWSFLSSVAPRPDEPARGTPDVLVPAEVPGSAVVIGAPAVLLDPVEELGCAVALGPAELFGTGESSFFPCVDLIERDQIVITVNLLPYLPW